MKNLKWIIGITLLAITLNVNAQRKERSPEQIAKQRTERMTEKFDLSAEQQEEVRKINQASAEKMKEVNAEKLTQEEREIKMKEIREENRKQISALLTEEQKAKAKEIRNERKQRKGGHMKGQH